MYEKLLNLLNFLCFLILSFADSRAALLSYFLVSSYMFLNQNLRDKLISSGFKGVTTFFVILLFRIDSKFLL